jgi:predicted adenine nucleotide alpha hydrolase (AANH) superfamily ATPase
MTTRKKKLLLHTCCAPCSPHVVDLLSREFEVSAFFYNPNIHPLKEYALRLKEIKEFSRKQSVELIVGEYDSDRWFGRVEGMEQEKEGGRRCQVCFRMRLEKTALVAQGKGFHYFTTTLSVSPHKNAQIINQIGRDLQGIADVAFYEADFKKRDGFRKSCELSKKHGFYRQNYCGCIYSQKQKLAPF